MTPIRLTQTVQKGGCAAKVAAHELRKLLGLVRFPAKPEELLVDGEHFDDAAIYRLSPTQALVQTLDFFTPIVDSSHWFGKIAAANAISDVYAMGGRPATCMAILAYPVAQFAPELVAEVLQGACDVMSEAKAGLAGGHSIDDDTLKFGLSVTGFVNPQTMWTNAGARPGDVLILTKPLGTGTLTAALKRSETTEEKIEPALKSMARLNNVIDFLSPEVAAKIHAATDVTGFGLIGHGLQMAEASGVTFEIDSQALPVFEGVMDSLKAGFLTKAHRSNTAYAGERVRWRDLKDPLLTSVVSDPQTSGGLLISVPGEHATEVLRQIQVAFPDARKIGGVLPQQQSKIEFI